MGKVRRWAPVPAGDRAPRINIPRLRGLLAEHRVPQDKFAEVAGINSAYLSSVFAERYPAGELTRFKLAHACRVFGFSEAVQPLDDEELLSRLA